MIAILIIAHERLGETLIECATHMLGEMPPQLRTLSVRSGDEPATILEEAQKIMGEIDSGDGFLILSDIFGGTPCNTAMKLVSGSQVKGISGLNLPMLISALNYRHLAIENCLKKMIDNSKESIIHFNKIGYEPYD